MSEPQSPKRILGEVAHLFFSDPPSRPAWPDDSAPGRNSGQAPGRGFDFAGNQGLGLLSSLFLSGQRQFAGAAGHQGIILLDQDKIVAFINRPAQELLGLTDKKYLGQLFDYFISLDEPLQVSIFRTDRTMGVGKMTMTENPLPGAPSSYTVTVRDITDSIAPARRTGFRQ